MATDRNRARRWAKEIVVVALITVAWWALQTYLPTDGWGSALRWVMAAVLVLGVVGLIAEAVVEFRQGYSGEDQNSA